jgi:excisionase family DNA binding protein
MKILSTSEAAERLKISSIRIRQLIREGRLPAQKVGRDYIIQEKDLELVEDRRNGRPPKAKNEADEE